MNKIILVLIVLSTFISSANGTRQIRDVLQISDNYYPIRELPLSSFISEDDLIKLAKPQVCTASWRGYQADWKLKEGFLWLANIEKNPCSREYEQLKAEVLFKDKEYPIKADWFTGVIQLQISETKYLFIDNDEEKELTGVNYEVLTFRFEDGKLISKEIEPIEVRY